MARAHRQKRGRPPATSEKQARRIKAAGRIVETPIEELHRGMTAAIKQERTNRHRAEDIRLARELGLTPGEIEGL